MSDSANLLQAGAILPTDTAEDVDVGKTDAISARQYHHAALTEPVVRLSADSLAQGDDLAMEYLGFDAPQVDGPLGFVWRQALGFPAWALIHDPEHAGYALDVVKDMKREQRRAKSKPGHAFDGYTDIAKRLGASVAHFLPSYWEEAGRTFLQLGNATFASRAFNKAREAERVHALDVDEGLRRDVFLEFALGGALAIKTVTQYGKDLLERLEPTEAWELFRELCLRRTLGGMPPWATMHRDLERLLKATDLDKDASLEALVGELLESPAIANAPEGFWKGVSPQVNSLVSQRPDLAGKLLNLFPSTDAVTPQVWLTFLDNWGILENVWESNDEQAGPQGGVSAWVARALTQQFQVCPALMALLPKASDKLRAAEEPLSIATRHYRSQMIDLDALDLLLELKIPVEDPPAETAFWLHRHWARPMDGAAGQPRDPVHVVQDPRFRSMLTEAVEQAAGSEEFEQAAAGMQGMAEARKGWLLEQIANIETGAVANARLSIGRLQSKTEASIFAEFPEALPALQAIDLAPTLHRTLQAGVIDEYGWPALEEAAESLDPEGKTTLHFAGTFPYAIVHDEATAIVVEHDRESSRHELRYPKGAALEGFAYVDGQLAVYYRLKGALHVYWSGDPTRTQSLEAYRQSNSFVGAAVPLNDGGSFTGQDALYAGDLATRPAAALGCYDGEHFWRQDRDKDYNVVLREWSPSEGDGRRSLPSFFEDYIADGGHLEVGASYVLDYGDMIANSPLGSKDGQIGLRVKIKDGRRFTEDIAGRTWESGVREPPHPCSFLQQAEGDAVNLVAGARVDTLSRYNDETRIFCPDGNALLAVLSSSDRSYNRGQATHLPVIFWHHFQVRDPENSRRLRGVSLKDARQLLEAAVADRVDAGAWSEEPVETHPALEKVLDQCFPRLHTRLRAGLIGMLDRAAAAVGEWQALIEQRDPSRESVASELDGKQAETACQALSVGGEWRADYSMLLPHIRGYREWLADEAKSSSIPACPVQWRLLLDRLETRLWRMMWESGNEDDTVGKILSLDDRELGLKLAEVVIGLDFGSLPGKLRVLWVASDRDHAAIKKHNDRKQKTAAAFESSGNKYLVVDDSYYYTTLLEYAPNGKFACPAGLTFESETPLAPPKDAAFMASIVERIRTLPRPQLTESQIGQLAEKLDVDRGFASLFWMAGAFTQRSYKNYLPKSIRTACGLKVNEADTARNLIGALEESRMFDAVSAMTEADPWNDPDAAISALAAAFQVDAAPTLHLPGAVFNELESLTRDMWANYWNAGPTMTLAEFLEMIATPAEHPLLQSDPKLKPVLERYSVALEAVDGEPCLTHKHLDSAVRTFALLNYRLPNGDPAKKALPDFYIAVKERLERPNLFLELGTLNHYEDDKSVEFMTTMLGKPKSDGDMWHTKKKDRMLVGSERRVLAAIQAKALGKMESFRDLKTWGDTLDAMEDFSGTDILLKYAYFGSSGMWSMMKRIVKEEGADGTWDQNPVVSAPDLVEQVQSHYKLSTEAAAYYLQLLALPDPMDKHIKVWSDWKPATIKRAGTELVEQGLVLEAKRARAGRKFFLPGGWEALKSPHAPMERWKLDLYKIRRYPHSDKLFIPLGQILPVETVGALFAKAWQRVLDGDPPQYEEV